jgi:hypothetical protein
MKLLALLPLILLSAFGQDSTSHPPAGADTTAASNRAAAYKPISAKERLKWFTVSTVGPVSLVAAGPLSAGLGTMLNRPKEYDTHWEGFGKRYGMRLTGVSTGNAIEDALGAIWGEDPRYFPSPKRGFGTRTKYVMRSSFIAPYRDGSWHPAYARFLGNMGNNFLSNTWRVRSENGAGDAALRCAWGFTADLAGNAFSEFWPDVKRKLFHSKRH